MRVPIFSPLSVDARVDLGAAVSRVLGTHRYILSSEVERFERDFAAYCGTEHCVGVANGTDALELALRALEVEAGDRVLVVANAGFYASSAVRSLGAIPAYVEIDPATLTMSTAALATALATRPAAIIVTHLYGQLADIEGILTAARQAHVPVIEDCAQAHGARRVGGRAGTYGEIGCFSFYPTKNLGAIGDGGAIVTSDASLAARVRQLRQYGWQEKYHVATPGGRNSRLDEVQAAVLNAKLPYLDEWNMDRREVARRYVTSLSGLPVQLPPSLDEDYVAHLFVIRVENRDKVRKRLGGHGVQTEIHYPVADHRQPAYPDSDPPPALPVTESACETVLTLPCYPGLTADQQQTVIDAVQAFFGPGAA